MTKEQMLDTVARHLARHYTGKIDLEVFYKACRECGVDPNLLTREDITEIQRRLNQIRN